MGKLIVTNTSVLLPDMTIARGQTVETENGIISAIRPYQEGEEITLSGNKKTELLDGSRKLLMPGLCDSHMHTGQQLLKGQILDALPMIWTRIMLPFESTLTPEKMELSAELAALEMIKSGTTSFVDAGSYFMESAADVYLQSGLRGLLSASTMDDASLPDAIRHTADQNVAQTDALYDAYQSASTMDDASLPDAIRHTADQNVAQTDALYDAYHGKGNLKVAYSLRSLISCTEELILKAAGHAKERGALLQAHMNEYPNEINFFLQRFGMRPIEYLEKLGVLDERFLAAHCILLSENEKDLLKKYEVKTCHCPFSNCGKGVPDTPALLQRGITVGLGTDGAAHGGLSLWNEMKIFRSVMNVGRGVGISEAAVMPAAKILRMATQGGYDYLHENGGSIAVGKEADFITISLWQPHLYPTGNLVNTLLECVTAADVCDNVVRGKILMKDHAVQTLDEARILAKAERYFEQAEKITP